MAILPHGGGGHGMGLRGRGRGRGFEHAEHAETDKSPGLIHLLGEVWPFVRPQRWLLLFGFGLMAINRLAGLVLPASTKFLIDNIIGKRQVHLLGPLAMALIAATAVQGVTSFTLTQLLSKAAQVFSQALHRRSRKRSRVSPSQFRSLRTDRPGEPVSPDMRRVPIHGRA